MIIYKHDDGVEYEYPQDYGTSCAAWDEGLPPYCNKSDSPSWCPSVWCYVDKATCSKSDLERTTFFEEELYYSYENCGTYDSWAVEGDFSSNGSSFSGRSSALGLGISTVIASVLIGLAVY